MNVLGIETSCDETSAAVVKDGKKILSNVISSQISTHQPYGGVVPEIASRKHLENILPVIQQALLEAGIEMKELHGVAVTYGPGLAGALLVGISAAKALAYGLNIPLVGVNHIEGHIYANFLENDLEFPMLCLVVSGGHTSLVYLKDVDKKVLLGSTRDDAAGEVFDKLARKMNLGYPGGPVIEKMAVSGEARIPFPRAWLDKGSYDFSFSGLKTAVINYLNKQEQENIEIDVPVVCASFQEAVFDVLVAKTLRAALAMKVKTIAVAGGVAANKRLIQRLAEEAKLEGIALVSPPLVLCTDNAAMIACAGYYHLKRGNVHGLDLNAVPNLQLNVEK